MICEILVDFYYKIFIAFKYASLWIQLTNLLFFLILSQFFANTKLCRLFKTSLLHQDLCTCQLLDMSNFFYIRNLGAHCLSFYGKSVSAPWIELGIHQKVAESVSSFAHLVLFLSAFFLSPLLHVLLKNLFAFFTGEEQIARIEDDLMQLLFPLRVRRHLKCKIDFKN